MSRRIALLNFAFGLVVVGITFVLTFDVFTSQPTRRLDHRVVSMVVKKSARTLALYGEERKLLKVYRVAIGRAPRGHKTQEGDGKTPEGNYYIVSKNSRSRFHRSLKISYPNKNDLNIAKQKGVKAGGDIMLHGIGKNNWVGGVHFLWNWTNGCIAVTNSEIDEIYSVVSLGTPILITE